MVCARCITVVEDELTRLGLHNSRVGLGEADLTENISAAQYEELRLALLRSGLELMNDKKIILVEKIKTAIIDRVHHTEATLVIKLSAYLSQKLLYDYTYLANLFSESQGLTIEKFFIRQKIDRVRTLLTGTALTLTEIAYRMNYSSVAHLSTQFKKVTGVSPSHFRDMASAGRPLPADERSTH
jgi:AraC-like DNA-binding protein